MTGNGHSQRFGAVNLGEHRHICAFFNSMDEEHRVLRSFYSDGFDRGEKATHIVDAENRDPYLKRLAEDGIDVRKMMGTGQLEVLPWTDMYVRDHRFDQDAMLASVEQLITSGARAGYTHSKLVGHHMDWVFVDKPAVNNLLEYEARLNELLSKYSAPVVCNYDVSQVSASVAIDIIRTHPVVIIGGLLQENPFFVPPDKFLAEMRRRRSGRVAGAS
jgi:MEDS: MEthanogen/methylotroph, DcmR Sensory domain